MFFAPPKFAVSGYLGCGIVGCTRCDTSMTWMLYGSLYYSFMTVKSRLGGLRDQRSVEIQKRFFLVCGKLSSRRRIGEFLHLYWSEPEHIYTLVYALNR